MEFVLPCYREVYLNDGHQIFNSDYITPWSGLRKWGKVHFYFIFLNIAYSFFFFNEHALLLSFLFLEEKSESQISEVICSNHLVSENDKMRIQVF